MNEPRTVLLVEDEPARAEPVRAALLHVAPRVRVVLATGRAAGLAAARRAAPDLIVLDVARPEACDWALLTALRRSDHTVRTPVLVLAGRDDPGGAWRAYQAHASAFIVRPEGDADLRWALRATCTFWFDCAALLRWGKRWRGA